MNGLALYNEIDDFAASWLEALIAGNEIAPGIVDRRSIEDLEPDYVRQFTQVHLFAGIGIWSRALRDAGVTDDRPVWTGSCPCPPFSSAGKKKACPECSGTNPVPHIARTGYFVCCLCGHEWLADGRHLWPEFWRLIRDCRPQLVLGEQVAGADGVIWLDTVRASLEIVDYALGGADTPAAGYGSPQIRQRLHWAAIRNGVGLADADGARLERRVVLSERAGQLATGPGGVGGGLAEPHDALGRSDLPARDDHDGPDAGRPQDSGDVGPGGGCCGLADCDGEGRCVVPQLHCGTTRGGDIQPGPHDDRRSDLRGLADAESDGHERAGELGESPRRYGEPYRSLPVGRPGPVNGPWRAADWIFCRDEPVRRWRPVEPSTLPLAHAGTYRNRVGLLRGAGNAIVLEQAKVFVETVMEYTDA